MPFGRRQSSEIEIAEDRGSIEEIQPLSSATQSQKLSHRPNGIVIALRALIDQV